LVARRSGDRADTLRGIVRRFQAAIDCIAGGRGSALHAQRDALTKLLRQKEKKPPRGEKPLAFSADSPE